MNPKTSVLLLFHHCLALKVINRSEQFEDVIPKFNLTNQKYQRNEECHMLVTLLYLTLPSFPHLKQGYHKRSNGECGQNAKTAL